MTGLVCEPTIIDAAGRPPKRIEEYVGGLNTPSASELSMARMVSPEGWSEPGQTPDFDEYTLVLRGCLHVATRRQTFVVHPGQAFIASKNEWVRYSTPDQGGAEYVSVCVPAFSPGSVHRDPE